MSIHSELVNPLLVFSDTGIRFIAGSMAIITWLSIELQWTQYYSKVPYRFGTSLARFLGYFTIVSNLLVALLFTAWFCFPLHQSTDPLIAGITTTVSVYIIIVAVIYHTLLRKTAVLQGLDRLANAVLHTWIPLIYVLCWYLFVAAGTLQPGLIPYILILPILYLIYVMRLGRITQHYPYPFINVAEKGYPVVLRNALCIALAFAGVAWLLIILKN